jgi:predicted PurR-regulated permease PerM
MHNVLGVEPEQKLVSPALKPGKYTLGMDHPRGSGQGTRRETHLERPSILKPLLILTAGVVMLAAMHFAASFLVPIMMALFFAVLLSPIYGWLKRRRVPGGLALLLSIGVLALVALVLLWLVGDALTTLAVSLASYGEQFSQRQAQLQAMAGELGQTSVLKPLIAAIDPASLVAVLGFFVVAATDIFKSGLLILLVAIFALGEGPQFQARMVRAFGADHFLPRNTIALASLVISYFGLRALVNLVVATATGIMLWLFGIPHAGLWGVITFFFSFVPYIGAVVALISPVLLAYAEGGPILALVIIVLALVINALSENIVAPLVMGKGLSVSPTIVFVSFIFWMFILGGAGAFLAMPLTVALMLFMGSFDETSGLAAMMGTTPEPGDSA